jgi:hypothetical protein
MSVDRHGASNCGSPGGRAAAGPGSPSTATPPPAGSCRTEITRPDPVHRAHAANFAQRRMTADERTLGQLFDRFERLQTLRAILQATTLGPPCGR